MMKKNEHYQELLRLINKLTYSHSTWEVFSDFVEMSAICIRNSVDTIHFDDREKQYLNTIKKYIPEHQSLFPDMFAHLVLALEYELETGGFTDILGCLFHELELHNKYKGQYFTPQHICTMMGKMIFSEKDKTILDKSFITVSEPACGSGVMVLGFAQAMKDCGYNHSQQMVVTAVDIDLKCVYMCYIQLSLYGIPAVVIHGNSLTVEEWSHWYTPVYVIGGWAWKKQHIVTEQENSMEESQMEEFQNEVMLPTPTDAILSYEQLNLFKSYEQK